MWSKQWWLDVAERLLRTFAQTFLAVFIPNGITPVADWKTALISAGTAAVLSLLMSVAASGIGNPSSASLVRVAPNIGGRHELNRRPFLSRIFRRRG